MSKLNSRCVDSYSGARLQFYVDDGIQYVKKDISGHAKRDERSLGKLINFKGFTTQSVRISSVEVLETKYINDTLSIIMPYVSGISGSDFAIHGDAQIATVLNDALTQLVTQNLTVSQPKKVPIEIFSEKLYELRHRCNIQEVRIFIDKVITDLKYFDRSIEMPIGPCHGDLTFANIILTSYHGLILIDFLYLYLETPLQDVAKLIQEYEYGWSFRYLSEPLKVKGQIFAGESIPIIVEMMKNTYGPQLTLLTRLALLRIAPYVKDKATEVWLVQSLTHYFDLTD